MSSPTFDSPSPARLPLPIHSLSSSTRSLLRSAPLLSTLPQCIAELIENALDASASHIHVVVDCARLSFSVADDGRGMGREELERCGTRHWTTKGERRDRREGEHTRYVFGARGEAIASLADIATVDITTTPSRRRHTHSTSSSAAPASSRRHLPSTYHKRLSAHSTTAVTHTASSPTSSHSHGTTVAVTHFYGTLPVRRRLLLSRRDRERELIKRRVERIALVHRHVVFTVWDDEHRRQLLSKGRLTDLPSSFAHLYRHDLAQSLLPLMTLHTPIAGIRLYVSSLTTGYHTRDYQLLYCNRRPIVHPTLQRCINRCWQRCRLFMEGGPTPGMRVMHAVFVLLLMMDEHTYDCMLEADKQVVVMADEDAVVDAVRTCMRDGLISQYPVLKEKSTELFDSVDGDERRARRNELEDERNGGEKENDSCSSVVADGAFIDLTGDVTLHVPSRSYSRLSDACSLLVPTSQSARESDHSSHVRRTFSSFNYSQDRPTLSSTSRLRPDAVPSVSASIFSPLRPQSIETIQLFDDEPVDEQRIQPDEHDEFDVRAETVDGVGTVSADISGARIHRALVSPQVILIDDAEVEQSAFPVFYQSDHASRQSAQARSNKRRRVDAEVLEQIIEPSIDLTREERNSQSEAAVIHSGRLAASTPPPSQPAAPPARSLPFIKLSLSRPKTASRPSVRSLQPALDEGEQSAKATGGVVNNAHTTALSTMADPTPAARPVVFNLSNQPFLSSQADHLTFPSPIVSMPRSSSPSRPPVLALHKRMLVDARVIGQVNHMFVLCLFDNRHLVAVDQHAADERVRLEDLEAHIQQLVGSQPLTQPLQCQLTHIECGTLQQYKQQINRWGWRLTPNNDDQSTTSHTHTITHCPALLLPPIALLDTVTPLHDYLAQLSHSLRSPSHTQLPTPLLSLLHSRACKSAIRFGDVMSESQQVALVRALGRCQLPFQCAHGRPSMQPLIDVTQRTVDVVGGAKRLTKGWKERVRQKLGRLTAVQEAGVVAEEDAAESRVEQASSRFSA